MAAIAKGGERMVALNLALRCAARIASEIEAFEPVVAFLGNRPGIPKYTLTIKKGTWEKGQTKGCQQTDASSLIAL
jgi:hypothetical protein